MEEINSEVSKRLNTMLPLDVFENLTKYAKRYASTGLGKFDYGMAIRMLLIKSELCDEIKELDYRISKLENKESKPQEENKGYVTIKTLGDSKLNNTEEKE